MGKTDIQIPANWLSEERYGSERPAAGLSQLMSVLDKFCVSPKTSSQKVQLTQALYCHEAPLPSLPPLHLAVHRLSYAKMDDPGPNICTSYNAAEHANSEVVTLTSKVKMHRANERPLNTSSDSPGLATPSNRPCSMDTRNNQQEESFLDKGTYLTTNMFPRIDDLSSVMISSSSNETRQSVLTSRAHSIATCPMCLAVGSKSPKPTELPVFSTAGRIPPPSAPFPVRHQIKHLRSEVDGRVNSDVTPSIYETNTYFELTSSPTSVTAGPRLGSHLYASTSCEATDHVKSDVASQIRTKDTHLMSARN